MRTQTILIALLTLFAAGSCTVQKRLYSKGFHVEFHKSFRTSQADKQAPTQVDEPEYEIPFQETGSELLPVVQTAEKTGSESADMEEFPSELAETEQIDQPLPEATTFSMLPKRNTHAVPTTSSYHKEAVKSVKSNSLQRKSGSSYPYGKIKKRGNWKKVLLYILIWTLVAGLIVLILLSPIAKYFLIAVCACAAAFLFFWLISLCFGEFEWFWCSR